MKLGSLFTAFGAFVNQTATPADAAVIIGHLVKMRPLANQYELHDLEVKASGRIGGVNIVGSYKFTFDDDNTIATGEALGITLPEELRPMVQENMSKLAKAMTTATPSPSDDGLYPIPFGPRQ